MLRSMLKFTIIATTFFAFNSLQVWSQQENPPAAAPPRLSSVYLADVLPKTLGGRQPSRAALATYWRTGKSRINGEEYAKSISFRSAWNAATATFAAGGFDYFDATVALVQDDASQTVTTSSKYQATVTMWSNTGKLFAAPPLHPGDPPLKLHIPLHGAKTLMLSYVCNDQDGQGQTTWWGDARLSKLTTGISASESNRPSPTPGPTAQAQPRLAPLEIKPAAPPITEQPAVTESSSVPEIAMEIGGLDLNQLQVLDGLIHKRIKALEHNRK